MNFFDHCVCCHFKAGYDIEGMLHDFWCQVAIAALFQWSHCYAFPWNPMFVGCVLYWHPRMR